jgi:hypothetical protein
VGSREFGHYVNEARLDKGYSKSKLGRRIGELPKSGRAFDAAGINRIVFGAGVRLDRELVDRLVTVLDLDPFLAYELADLRPVGFSADDHRDFALAGGTKKSSRISVGRRLRAA